MSESVAGDERTVNTVKGEVSPDEGNAADLERDLKLGVQKIEPPVPGMRAYEGGGLSSEIGRTPPETDPD